MKFIKDPQLEGIPQYLRFRARFHVKTGSLLLENETSLIKLKQSTKRQQKEKGKLCTVLLLSNLAYPQWLLVFCNKKQMSNIVCQLNKNKPNALHLLYSSRIHCENFTLECEEMCFHFMWVHRSTFGADGTHKEFFVSPTQRMSFAQPEHNVFPRLLSATHLPKMTFILRNKNTSSFVKTTLEKLWHTRVTQQSERLGDESGHVVFSAEIRQFKITFGNVFLIPGKGYASTRHVCDKKDSKLMFPQNYRNISGKVLHVQTFCAKRHCTPSTCASLIKMGCSTETTKVTHTASRKTCEAENKQHKDCRNVSLFASTENKQMCSTKDELPCKDQNQMCFEIEEICIFRINSHNQLHPCLSGSHIEECTDFECHQHFKCPGYYCVPWGYTCDGKWDCPNGYDESELLNCGVNRSCENMFLCKNSQICVHLYDICSNSNDCPFGDDELFCELRDVICPNNCTCCNFALVCEDNLVSAKELSNLPHLSMSILNCSIFSLSSFTQNENVVNLNVSRNYVEAVCQEMSSLTRIHSVDFSRNFVKKLSTNCFAWLVDLTQIIMKRNLIRLLSYRSFSHLGSVFLIDLSNNNISFLPYQTFYNTTIIHNLILHTNPLKSFAPSIFAEVHVNVVDGTFHICCAISSHSHIKSPWFTSCSTLLPDIFLQSAFVVVSLVILVGNIFSLLTHVIHISKKRRGTLFSIFISFLNCADILSGVYLSIIWVATFAYGPNYVLFDFTWRRNIFCKLDFALLFLGTLLAPYLISILSLGGLMVVLYPFKSKFKSPAFLWKLVGMGFIISAISAGAATFYSGTPHLPTNLCSPFIDPNSTTINIKIFTYFAAVYRLAVFVFICVVHLVLIWVLKKNTFAVLKSYYLATRIIQQVLFIALNFVGWFSSTLIFVFAPFQSPYPVHLLIWTTAVIMPLNSITNPFIFLVTHRKSEKPKNVSHHGTKTQNVL